jgi:hypothetical protein
VTLLLGSGIDVDVTNHVRTLTLTLARALTPWHHSAALDYYFFSYSWWNKPYSIRSAALLLASLFWTITSIRLSCYWRTGRMLMSWTRWVRHLTLLYLALPMYVCMYVCMYSCMYMYVYISMYVCLCASMFMCMYVYVQVCLCACMYIFSKYDFYMKRPLMMFTIAYAQLYIVSCGVILYFRIFRSAHKHLLLSWLCHSQSNTENLTYWLR